MTIVGCRIDGRLIHGQVANLWTTKLNVSRIMVIDDEVAQNDIEKSGLKLATPPGVKLVSCQSQRLQKISWLENMTATSLHRSPQARPLPRFGRSRCTT